MSEKVEHAGAREPRRVEIRITGPIASGKTVLMLLIAEMLQERGYAVSCTDCGAEMAPACRMPGDFRSEAGRSVSIATSFEQKTQAELCRRIHNLEAFMMAVAKELRHIPDFYDSRPDLGNAHIMRALKELCAAKTEPGPDSAGLQLRAGLLAALAGVANGRACLIEVYRTALTAWRNGQLTDAEADGIGRALAAIEKNG